MSQASLYNYVDGKLYRTRQVYVWSRNVSPAEDDGLPFKFTDGGSGGFDPDQYSMDVTAYTMFCGTNAQNHAEAWAATHCFRALALPTRCVAIK